MTTRSHWRRGSTWAVITAAMFIALSAIVLAGRCGSIDYAIIQHVQGWESPNLTSAMEALTRLGSTTAVAVITLASIVLLGAVLGHRLELILLAAVMVGTAILNKVLKLVFQRERPNFYRLIEETGFSFPSGHSMAAFALYGVLIYLLWRHIRANWCRVLVAAVGAALILGIGCSRIYLGVHYPSDVLGGYLMSAAWLGIAIEIFERKIRQRA